VDELMATPAPVVATAVDLLNDAAQEADRADRR
jgi:hypothetical protein